MNYLHYEFNLSREDAVKVDLSSQANVRLLDTSNFQAYKKGYNHKYYGGLVKTTPYIVSPPHSGHWHLVIDTGGYSGSVSASVQII